MSQIPAPLYANVMSPQEPATTATSPACDLAVPHSQPPQQMNPVSSPQRASVVGPSIVPMVPDVIKPDIMKPSPIMPATSDDAAMNFQAFNTPDKYGIFRRFPPMLGSDEGISRTFISHMRCLSPVQQFARAGAFLIFSFILMGIVLNVTTARMPDPTVWPELPDLGIEWTPFLPELEHVTDLLLWGLNIAVISLFFLLRRVALGRVAPPTRVCHLAQGAFDTQPQLCAAILSGELVVARRVPGISAGASAAEGPAGVWAASAIAAGDVPFDLVRANTFGATYAVEVGVIKDVTTIPDTAPAETAQPLLLGQGPESREDRQLINRHVAYLFPADDENLHVLAYARLFFTYAMAILGRCIVNLATSLPPTNNQCRWNPPHIADGAWNVVVTLLSFGSGNIHCGDLLYSGHSVCVAVTACMCWTYGPLVSRLYRPVAAILAMSTVFTILASRSHYSDDIIVAWMVTVGLFASIGHHPYGLPRWAQLPLQPFWWTNSGCGACSVYSLWDRVGHFLARKIDSLNVI